MTVTYKGLIKAAKNFEYRLAEIEFDEREFDRVERIAKLMGIKGYNVEMVTDEYAQCVIENRDEFKMFMKDWKESKKCIAMCERFGF